MNTKLIASLRTLLADPERPDRDALFAAIADVDASEILACLAPPGSLVQIAAAMARRWSWCCDGWERQTNELVHRITDPRCSVTKQMIETWSFIPNAVGVLRDRTNDLVTWAQQRLNPEEYDDLAILLGPSNAAAQLLVQSPSSATIGRPLRRWSMSTDPNDPTAWQEMIDPDLRAALHQRADPSDAFPAWGWDPSVDPEPVLYGVMTDVYSGWSPDHPSLRERIAWIERHVSANLDVGLLAGIASIGRSSALAEAGRARVISDSSSIPRIAKVVPWSRLHPRIQTVIDTTMRRSSAAQWKRTWAYAIGKTPVVPDAAIDASLLLWRINSERWKALDSAFRAAFVSRISDLPSHCYGWGVHPDLVAGKYHPYGDVFCFWNPDVLPDDLRAWAYADLLHAKRNPQDVRGLIDLLAVLPPNRRARFEQIIDWLLGGSPEAPPQQPWDWTVWAAFPDADRQRWLHDHLHALWDDRNPSPAGCFWRVRNDGLATLALMVGEVLARDDQFPILAMLLAQIPALQRNTTDVESSLPFPDDLNTARRAQIERLPIDRNAQAYAAWGLRVLEQDMGLGSTLIALHPDVAVALAPILTTEERAMVTDSPAAQGWDSMTVMHWAAACAPAQEQPMPPIQRRLP